MSTIVERTRRRPRGPVAGSPPDAAADLRFFRALFVSALLGACVWAAIGVAIHALLT